ncbi:hypothetical protein [Nonomuraea aridisoli]|uniref:Uncharacterized protein n=1 Tax=Nonomuraea aridisoli TaxID=2070368 RepID=A0A2W2EN38_9ACTN|nr:hypothetical protein [Nonomuraea aridisoli]PZG15000.1 hypothetical protein C1J01_25395 [Nonomuraea aridisoli]
MSSWATTRRRHRAETIESQFARFAAWCRSTASCALHGRDVGGVWRGLVAAEDRSAIPAKGLRVAYSGFDIKVAAVPDVISPGAAPDLPNWQRVARAIAQAEAGDAAGFAVHVRETAKSLKVPSFRGMNVTHCADGLGFTGYEEYRKAKELGERLSPNFAGNELWHPLGCVGWRHPSRTPRARCRRTGCRPSRARERGATTPTSRPSWTASRARP